MQFTGESLQNQEQIRDSLKTMREDVTYIKDSVIDLQAFVRGSVGSPKVAPPSFGMKIHQKLDLLLMRPLLAQQPECPP